MRSLLSLGLGTALALAYAPFAAGQAIIGYGINVGRAGTAGAATGAAGAGAAGIFKRLKGTLDAESETKPSQASTTERKPEFDKAPGEKPEDSAANRPAKPVFKSSGEVKTKSGVKISGLTPVTGPRRWAEPEPAQAWVPMPPGPAPSAPAPAPSQASASATGAPSARAGNPQPAPASAPAPVPTASGEGADGLPVAERGISHPVSPRHAGRRCTQIGLRGPLGRHRKLTQAQNQPVARSLPTIRSWRSSRAHSSAT